MLRSAIAHDIRSPLSVLKGYQEMLTEYLPGADIDREQAMEMLAESGRQIERMDAFVETSIRAIREKVGKGKVLCALSGGVDSSVRRLCCPKPWESS